MRLPALALVAFTATLSTPALATDDDGYGTAMAFASCSGIIDATADFAEPFDADLALYMRDQARGSRIAAAHLVPHIGRPFRDLLQWAENAADPHRRHWRLVLRYSGASDLEYQQAMALCTELSPLQAEIIGEFRRSALR